MRKRCTIIALAVIASTMMGFEYGMMGGGFGVVVGLVILADLILAGIWLWQHITKK